MPLMGFGSIPNKLQRCAAHYNSLALTPALWQENVIRQSARCLQHLPTASPFGLQATPAATARPSAALVTQDDLREKEKNPIKGRGQLQQLSQMQPFFTALSWGVPKSQPRSCSSAKKPRNPVFMGKILLLRCCSLGRCHQSAASLNRSSLQSPWKGAEVANSLISLPTGCSHSATDTDHGCAFSKLQVYLHVSFFPAAAPARRTLVPSVPIPR